MAPGHPSYGKLNQVLPEANFHLFVADLCAPHYKTEGLPGTAHGVHFRMILVGYLDGSDSRRGITWRCADSLDLSELICCTLTDPTAVHASQTHICPRPPQEVFEASFRFVLGLLEGRGLQRGQTVGIHVTTLEASAPMKSTERRYTGEGWTEYLKR